MLSQNHTGSSYRKDPISLKPSNSQQTSTPPPNGQTAPVLVKSEIRLTADLAGPSVLLKPSLIEFALKPIRPKTQEFLSKIYLPAVVSGVVRAATADTHQVPGHGGRIPESSPVTYIRKTPGASPTHWLHATITLMALYHHVAIPSQLQLARRHAFLNTLQIPTPMTNTLALHLTAFTEFRRSCKKSTPMDQLKVHSQFIRTS